MNNLKYICLSFLLVSCFASTTIEPKAPESKEDSIVTVKVCEDSSGSPLKCEYNQDCCSNEFYCGLDPEVSHVTKVCIYNPW